MTQVWPVFGEAPVPTLLSMIWRPEAVVMGFPAVWAIAVLPATDVETAAARPANAVVMIVRREDRILHLS
ncbi:hypothetical protein BraRD5C2_30100 [Bradyrhizobium sp. RD5-C2]|nr:hypothetical protein BraRD5C2_30100 [Bradyrhizobium sp. RD5-C2]